jgi:hypothetical protein
MVEMKAATVAEAYLELLAMRGADTGSGWRIQNRSARR